MWFSFKLTGRQKKKKKGKNKKFGRTFLPLALLGWEILGGGVVAHECGFNRDRGKWSCFPSVSPMDSPLVASVFQ